MDKSLYFEKDIGSGGYIGNSMSVRAKRAYDSGEMPKSKWTKEAMLEAILDASDEVIEETIRKKMNRNQIFEKFFFESSWHHTGALYNRTVFYSLNTGLLFSWVLEKVEDGTVDIEQSDFAKSISEAWQKKMSKEEKCKRDYETFRKVAEEVIAIERISRNSDRIFCIGGVMGIGFAEDFYGLVRWTTETKFDRKRFPDIVTVSRKKVIEGIVSDNEVGAYYEYALSERAKGKGFKDFDYDESEDEFLAKIEEYEEIASIVTEVTGERADYFSKAFRAGWNRFNWIYYSLPREENFFSLVESYSRIKSREAFNRIIEKSDKREYEVEYD